MGNKLEAWFRSSSVLERRKPSVHTRAFISLSRFCYFSLSLSLFPLLFQNRPLPPFQALCILYLSFSFSFFLSLFCVTRTLHRRSSILECSTLYTAMFTRKSNPFLARPTNGSSLSLIRQRVQHHLFMRSFVQFKISSFPFSTCLVSRIISTYHFRYNRADVLQDPFAASFSWLPSCCCFYILPCLVSVFLLLSQLFQFRPDARVLPVLEHNITFLSLPSNSWNFYMQYIYIWNSNLISFNFFSYMVAIFKRKRAIRYV